MRSTKNESRTTFRNRCYEATSERILRVGVLLAELRNKLAERILDTEMHSV